MKTKSILLTTAITLAVTLPLAAFAANNDFVRKNIGQAFEQHLPKKIEALLTASGIAIPTDAEFQSHHEAMEKVRKSIDSLSETDKAALKTLRETAQKAERDFLRSKGVPFPSEEELAKFQTFHQKLQEVLKAERPNFRGMHDNNENMNGPMMRNDDQNNGNERGGMMRRNGGRHFFENQ